MHDLVTEAAEMTEENKTKKAGEATEAAEREAGMQDAAAKAMFDEEGQRVPKKRRNSSKAGKKGARVAVTVEDFIQTCQCADTIAQISGGTAPAGYTCATPPLLHPPHPHLDPTPTTKPSPSWLPGTSTRTVTPAPQRTNPAPRFFRQPSAFG